MAKHARSSIDSALLASTYSTRSSIRRSLNLKTEIPSDQPSTDRSSTPSTPSTDLSTDLQKSPASSQTSSNIVDSSSIHISPSQTTMPPKAKAVKSAGAKSTSAQTKGQKARNASTLDMAAQATENKADRPGRARKPTQKAAELAANRSSKLSKSITERNPSKEIDDDGEDSSDEVDPLAMDEPNEDEVKPTISPKKIAPASIKQRAATQAASPSPSEKLTRMTGARKGAKLMAPKATTPAPITSKKRKQAEDPEEVEEIPQKKTKTASTSTQITGSTTPTSPVGLWNPCRKGYSSSESSQESENLEEAPVKKIDTTDKRLITFVRPAPHARRRRVCQKVQRKFIPIEEPEDLEETPAKKTETVDKRVTRSMTPGPVVKQGAVVSLGVIYCSRPRRTPRHVLDPNGPIPIADTVKGKQNASSTEDTPKAPSSEPTKPTKQPKGTPTTEPIASQPAELTSTPTTLPTATHQRFKLKFSPTIASALEGVTGLPCALACLQPEQLIYTYAKIIVEEEGLVEEVTSFPEFDGDVSRKACALRRRWNMVLAGYCECGRSEGVASGGWKGRSWEKRGS